MTMIYIDATLEDLTNLATQLGVRKVELAYNARVDLKDGEEGAVLSVPFSMLQEGDYKVCTYGKKQEEVIGGLEWDDVSQGRLRGFFHRMLPDMPKRIECEWAMENLDEMRRKLIEGRDALEIAARFLEAAVVEDDAEGKSFVERIAAIAKLAEDIYLEFAYQAIRVDYKAEPPAQRLVSLKEETS